MNKEYVVPELEIVKLGLKDVILYSPTEPTIPEVIGGGDGSSSELDDDDL